jgi:uncharacterized protein (DUF2147 family)
MTPVERLRGVLAWGLAGLLLVAAAAAPAPADRILGDWMVDSRDAIVRIEGHGSGDQRRYAGRIVWLKDDHYHPADGAALDGRPVMDLHNPDPALRSRPLLGIRLVWDLRYDGELWTDGHVYNSDNGQTYGCLVRLVDDDHLKLRGFIGIPLFGGSTIWTRVSDLPRGALPPEPPGG